MFNIFNLILRNKIIDWEKQHPIIVEQKIEIDWFFKDLEALEYNIDNLEKELYQRGWEQEKDNKDRNKRNPFETELSRLRTISRKNYQIKSDFVYYQIQRGTGARFIFRYACSLYQVRCDDDAGQRHSCSFWYHILG